MYPRATMNCGARPPSYSLRPIPGALSNIFSPQPSSVSPEPASSSPTSEPYLLLAAKDSRDTHARPLTPTSTLLGARGQQATHLRGVKSLNELKAREEELTDRLRFVSLLYSTA